jgi:hypothetical protein
MAALYGHTPRKREKIPIAPVLPPNEMQHMFSNETLFQKNGFSMYIT